MPDSLSSLLNQGSLLASIAGLLLFTYFIFGFALPARRQGQALSELNRGIRDLAAGTAITPPQKAAALFSGNAAWALAWAEFEKSLRLQHETADSSSPLKSVQAGVPAATLFSRSVLIDPAIERKTFRAMPLCVGIFGLLALVAAILGVMLRGGDDAAQAGAVALPTEALLAAILSFVPMSLGIAAAGFRKQLPEALPSLADDVVQALDGLYRPQAASMEMAPAAMETRRAEVAAAEAAMMRDMLAKVLGEVLAAQIGRQTMSIQSSTATISGDIVKSVARAMEQPLGKIVEASEASARHAGGMERLLKEAMSSMAHDISQSITKTFEKPLGQMVQVVEQSGRQAENVDRLLQGTMTSMVTKVEEATREQIKGLNTLILENAKSLHEMRQNISQMMDDLKKNTEYISGLTNASIEKMDLSAKTILGAAEKFGEAGEVMNSQISHAHSLSRHMMESGAALNGSSQALAQVVADYGKARDSIGSLIGTLQGVVKEVDQKVTINQSLVGDMQKVADRLKEVQAQTDQYLHQVSDVLSTGFNGFGKSVHENLDRSTSAFHASMSNSVELISVQMRNLTSALEELPELLRKPAA